MEKLGELIEVRHGFAFSSQHFVDRGPYVLLTPGNFYDEGGFKSRDAQKFYDGPVPAQFALKPGDLLVAMTEQAEGLLGSAAFVPPGPVCLHNQRLGLVRPRDGVDVDLRYIYYLFNSRAVRQQIRASASGTKIRHTAPNRIYDVNIPRIPLTDQLRIASILGAYDDLIEVNRQRVALLEDMARGLFEEWFVQFRFPGYDAVPMVDRQEGPLPEGWRWSSFGELVGEVRDGVSPTDLPAETPYVGLEHIPRRSTTMTEWGRAEDVGSLKLSFQRGDVLFGKIRPYFHKVVWAPFDGIASSDAIIYRPHQPHLAAMSLAVASSDGFVATSVQTSNGTKMPRANPKVLKAYRVATDDGKWASRFGLAMLPTIELAASLAAANHRLAASRDLLLPRLISGQLSVAVAERELLEAA